MSDQPYWHVAFCHDDACPHCHPAPAAAPAEPPCTAGGEERRGGLTREDWACWYSWYVGKDCKRYPPVGTNPNNDECTDAPFDALVRAAFSAPAAQGDARWDEAIEKLLLACEEIQFDFEDNPNGPGDFICRTCYASVRSTPWVSVNGRKTPQPSKPLVHEANCPSELAAFIRSLKRGQEGR